MVSTRETKSVSRQRAAAGKMTAAQRVQQRIASGAFKSELRTATEAIWMAKAMDGQLREAMREAGLNPKECWVHIAFMTPDLSTLSTVRFVEGTEQQMHDSLTGPGKCSIMVGLIFGIAERDPEKLRETGGEMGTYIGAKPLLLTERVREALKQRITFSEPGNFQA